MTTIIINEKSKKGRIILDLIHEIGVGKVVDYKLESKFSPNKTTLKAIHEVETGAVTKCADFEDYLKKTK